MSKVNEAKEKFLSEKIREFFEDNFSTEQTKELTSFNFKNFEMSFSIKNETEKVSVTGTFKTDEKEIKKIIVLELSNESESN